MPIIYSLREDFLKFHMTGPESKFDVRGDSLLAECKYTIVFTFYVIQSNYSPPLVLPALFLVRHSCAGITNRGGE